MLWIWNKFRVAPHAASGQHLPPHHRPIPSPPRLPHFLLPTLRCCYAIKFSLLPPFHAQAIISQMATVPAAAPTTARFRSHLPNSWCPRWKSFRHAVMEPWKGYSLISHSKSARRTTLINAVNQDAEKSFKKTLEVDRLIDMLRESNARELEKLVVENILAFNEGFWIRLAARTDTCKSDDDKKDYEELAGSIMSIVDRLVHKTNEKIESATDVLKSILKPVVGDVEEISWPPRNPKAIELMKNELEKREQEGQLDEGFLAEVNAQLRQAKEDGDKPGLEAMLQKVLQIYASKVLRKRSYAYKGDQVLVAERFLETIIEAPEDGWNKLLIEGLNVGKGEVSSEELYAVIKKRIERVLIRTEGGSYQQRILTEYLKGIQSRTEKIVQAFQGSQP